MAFRFRDTATKVVEAVDLQIRDTIANVGRIYAIRQLGVFTVCQVTTTEWSLVTGAGITVTRFVTFHNADNVVVDVA